MAVLLFLERFWFSWRLLPILCRVVLVQILWSCACGVFFSIFSLLSFFLFICESMHECVCVHTHMRFSSLFCAFVQYFSLIIERKKSIASLKQWIILFFKQSNNHCINDKKLAYHYNWENIQFQQKQWKEEEDHCTKHTISPDPRQINKVHKHSNSTCKRQPKCQFKYIAERQLQRTEII